MKLKYQQIRIRPLSFCEELLYRGHKIDDLTTEVITGERYPHTFIGRLFSHGNYPSVYINLTSGRTGNYEKYIEALFSKFDPDQKILTYLVETRVKMQQYCVNGITITNITWDDLSLIIDYNLNKQDN